MFKNYLITAYRNLKKTKLFSLINILGLAIGMAACLLILHYVNFERNYDKFHENYENIYRLRYERTDDAGASVKFASCCPPAAARIRGNYPEVEKIARLLRSTATVSYQNEKFLEERIYYAEPQFLDILKFPFIVGDPLTGINEPNTAFISQSTATKYFGDTDPIGKSISVNKRTEYQVTGIFKDIPQNSHLKFDLLLPWENMAKVYGPDYTEAWGHTGSFTYLVARPGTDPEEFEKKLLPLIETECPWLAEYNMTIDLKMQSLADIHLTSHFMQEYEANGDNDSINFLFIIAFFIIIMAWVNYVNLSTARSLGRAREVGMRKVVGASRAQLIIQFFFEIILLNLISVICAVGLVILALPFFSQITAIPTDFNPWTQGWFWITAVGMFLAGVVLSGLYPVLAMSSFKPVKVLKGKLGNSARGISLRKTLVVFQFAVGLFLIIGTFTVFKQISYMRSQELGFSMDQILVIKAPRVRDDNYGTKFDTYKEIILQRSEIDNVSHITEVPGRQIYWDAGAIRKAGSDISEGKNYQIVGIDFDFADVFDLKFAAGRMFSDKYPTDTGALILNETAVHFMGFENAESAVGEQVDYWGVLYPIVGVLKDYHQQSLKEEYEPHIFRYMPYGRGTMGAMAIKLNTGNIKETLEFTKRQYDEFFPNNPFDYFFLDDYYNQQYIADEKFGKVYSLFSILAIVITVLGIYGLSSYSITQLTREIGIRKVLGASISSIVRLLTKEFLILLAIANVIAWPIAYFAMNRWLESYAYRTGIGIEIFIQAAASTMIVAILTLSYQVIKAARANPVDAIAHE
jgi:putative ABC transport system permease protein